MTGEESVLNHYAWCSEHAWPWHLTHYIFHKYHAVDAADAAEPDERYRRNSCKAARMLLTVSLMAMAKVMMTILYLRRRILHRGVSTTACLAWGTTSRDSSPPGNIIEYRRKLKHFARYHAVRLISNWSLFRAPRISCALKVLRGLVRLEQIWKEIVLPGDLFLPRQSRQRIANWRCNYSNICHSMSKSACCGPFVSQQQQQHKNKLKLPRTYTKQLKCLGGIHTISKMRKSNKYQNNNF